MADEAVAEGEVKDETVNTQDDTGLDGGIRDAIYNDYNKNQTVPPAEKGDEDNTSDEEEKTDTSTETEDTDKDKPDTDVSDETESDKEETKIKTVPYDALHAERQKKKDALAKVKELEEENRRFREQSVKTDDAGADDDFATRKDTNALIQRIKNLEAGISADKERVQQEGMKKKQDDFNALVVSAGKDLTKEGFPGFEVGQHQIGDELRRIVMDDPEFLGTQESYQEIYDSKVRHLDNPDGWKKIYKEKVFPGIKAMFTAQQKKDLFDTKKDLKANANLVGSSGKTGKKQEGKKEFTQEEYVKERMANSLV